MSELIEKLEKLTEALEASEKTITVGKALEHTDYSAKFLTFLQPDAREALLMDEVKTLKSDLHIVKFFAMRTFGEPTPAHIQKLANDVNYAHNHFGLVGNLVVCKSIMLAHREDLTKPQPHVLFSFVCILPEKSKEFDDTMLKVPATYAIQEGELGPEVD